MTIADKQSGFISRLIHQDADRRGFDYLVCLPGCCYGGYILLSESSLKEYRLNFNNYSPDPGAIH